MGPRRGQLFGHRKTIGHGSLIFWGGKKLALRHTDTFAMLRTRGKNRNPFDGAQRKAGACCILNTQLPVSYPGLTVNETRHLHWDIEVVNTHN